MKRLRGILAFSLPLALALGAAVVWGVRRPRVCVTLYDLIGKSAEAIPAFVREASSSELSLIVSSADGAKARTVAREIARRYPPCERPDAAALSFLRENRGGLVATETAALLATREGRARVAHRAKRRLYASPLPPLLGYADDPFGLTEGFLATLLPKASVGAAGAFPVLVTNGVTHVLLRTRFGTGGMDGLEKTSAALDALSRAAAGCAAAGGSAARVSVALAGAPAHAAAAAVRCKREIGALTWLSLAVIAALALFAFRSVRWLPLLAGSLFASAFSGALALGVFFRELHLFTFVFGTTVLGLVIDYSFHWLLSPADAKTRVTKGLFVSFLTTEISLCPLMLSAIPVLRQASVFLGVGLAAALGYVLVAYPRGNGCVALRLPSGRSPRIGARWRCASAVCGAVLLLGLFRVTFGTDLTALYRPPPDLAAAERLRALFGTFDFSAFPSREVREKTASDVAALYAEHGLDMARTLGLETLPLPPAPRELLLRPQTFLTEMFARWTAETFERLLLSVAVLVVVLLIFCRRRAFRILLPPVGAILLTAGVLGWSGVPLNLFHLLAAFLLLGMGIDYAVFLTTGGAAAVRPAFCSLLTSVAGFGALAFVSFPAVRSFGVVLGLGLPLAYLLAGVMRERP